ncbi:MAG: tryptophan synthase subunit alpha [Phycisphaerales bacterium]|jgi:tryptophan synthase alpha chain|nr:tryptophan synthase subunit alpha [Phycisphaerales bacterium]
MNRIDAIFSTSKKALMPFIVAGYPTIDATEESILAMDSNGASIIEIGIPFSDPIADGPTIAAAMHEAVRNGVTPAHVIGLVSRVRSKVKAGLVAMVSESIVKRSGGSAFLDRLVEAGFDGIIIPDIDDEEAQRTSEYCKDCGLSFSMLVSPTTPQKRAAWLASLSSGFLYILARVGLTGEQGSLPDISKRIEQLQEITDLPLAVGFGISNKEHVQSVLSSADAAIVGSALVRRMGESNNPALAAGEFVSELS